ncbi:MAG: hypothetical protein K1X89_06690 [Myxococcaceae bacterium]|nr:hypothetical protein [Myxococcaceae bacterium]
MNDPALDPSQLAEQLEILRRKVETLEAQNVRRAARSSGLKKGLLAAALVLVVSNVAWGQLKTFVAGSPALASDINGNFTQLKTWLEQKVGTSGSADVTVTGLFSTPTASVSGPVYRGASVPATGDLGLYSEVGANWVRFVTNSGDFHFFTDGSAGNGFAGTTDAFAVLANGNAVVRGDLVVNGNATSGAWLAQTSKSPADGNALSAGGTPNSGWAAAQCASGQFVCGLAFTHPTGQNLLYDESFAIRCCSL